MEKMNFNEIMSVLKDKIHSVNEFAYEDYNSEELGLGEIKEVSQVGGSDQGSHWQSVKYFSDHDIYICVTGWYSSYNGADFYDEWDCCSEVRPQEKTITVYC
jgi:hypothetical protein